jgi:hypothetical protein
VLPPERGSTHFESGRHLSAFFRAFAARLRASLAMLVIVFGAFLSARIAHVRTDRAKPGRELTSAGHQAYRQCTQIGAIAVQLDTACHHLPVPFAQALRRAMLASDGAGDAGIHAALVFLM